MHKCPVCGKYEFQRWNSHDICPVCGWKPARFSEHNGMHRQLMTLSDEQLSFICSECHVSEEELLAMNDDDLYDRVYDPMCDIETEETPCDDSPESEHCRMASDIVTILGDALAVDES